MYKFNKRFKSYKIILIQSILNILVVIFDLLLPFLEGKIVNNLIAKNTHSLNFLIISLFIIFCLQMIISYISSKIMFLVIPKHNMQIQNEFVNYYIMKNMLQIRSFDQSYIHERLSLDIDRLLNFNYKILPSVFSQIFLVINILFFICNISVVFLLAFVFLLLIYVLIYMLTDSKLTWLSLSIVDESSRMFSVRNSMYQRIIEIKAKGTILFEQSFLKQICDQMFKLLSENFFYKYLVSSSKICISFIAQLCFFIFGGSLILKGTLTVGYFLTIMQYFLKLINSLDDFMSFSNEYRDYKVSYDRFFEILNIESIVEGNSLVKTINNIELLDFNIYLNGGKLYKNDISLMLKSNNIYQIIGTNGVGKSTFLLTLIGVFDNNYVGDIRINNLDFKSINSENLRNNCISIMLQNELPKDIYVKDILTTYLDLEKIDIFLSNPIYSKIFNSSKFSIYENINKVVSDLSGGERQLISLFITITKPNISLLILDEAFSNIAQSFDEDFSDLLLELKKDKIILFVTHRSISGLDCTKVYL